MDNTSFQAGAPTASETGIRTAPELLPPKPPVDIRAPRAKNPFVVALKVAASLRLTVTLFALSLFLVFYGTLAQVDFGIWTIVDKYFRSLLVWIPLHIILFRAIEPSTILIPFPGGWLLGGLLLTNLLAAHAVKFRFAWKRSGILLIHSGIVLMMLSEFVTGWYAIEGNMTIRTKSQANYVEHHLNPELAVILPGASEDKVAVIPGKELAGSVHKKQVIANEHLPVDVQALDYFRNSVVMEILDPNWVNPANKGEGRENRAIERLEVTGTEPDQKIDMPAAYIELFKKGTHDSLGKYLVSPWIYEPQKVSIDGKDYLLTLRFKRTYRPYTIYLDKFEHKKFLGTETPKDFRSTIRLVDPENNINEKHEIYMNHPLRYQGETFFQASFLPGDRGTVLQVVRNPGWMLPYISCIMVSLGMLFHFGMNLSEFVARRMAQL